MSSVNPITREVLLKVVYYGPGLGGKTTTLQHIHSASKPEHRGKMVSLATPVDRTLYFDFLPIRLPKIRGYTVRLQLFTVPGQVYYNATRKLVLTGADGVVFVADSQRERQEANLESLANLKENLGEHGASVETLPHVFQYNKRDLPAAVPIEEMDEALNELDAPARPTIATTGEGVFEALDAITRAILKDLRDKHVLWGDEEEAADRYPKDGFGIEEEGIVQTLLKASGTPNAVPPAPLGGLTQKPGASPAVRILSSATARPARSAPPPDPTAGPAALFASLFARDDTNVARGIEEALAADDAGRAVDLVEPAATRELAAAAAVTGESAPRDPALAALLLGIDGRRYLRFRSVCRKRRAGASIEPGEGLFCYLFLLDLRLRRGGL